jgi:hypothetical protein
MGDQFHYPSGRPKLRLQLETPLLNSNKEAASTLWTIRFKTPGYVKGITAEIATAGTGATAGFTIFKNTTSIGVVTCGVTAAGTYVTGTMAETYFLTTDKLVLKNVTSDLNLDARAIVDYYANHERFS